MSTDTLKVAPGGVIRKVALTLVRERKVIFARSKSQSNLFYTLGGKLEEGETPEDALVRESREEADIELIPGTIRPFHTFVGPCHGYVEGTKLEMLCFDAEYLGFPTPSNEIAELDWFTSADEHRTTPMGAMILRWFKQQDLID